MLTTPLSLANIQTRFLQQVRPKGPPLRSSANKGSLVYEGELSGNAFTISRIPVKRAGRGPNSFMLLVKGQIQTGSGLSDVNISMRPFLSVQVFMAMWMGILGLICLAILIALVLGKDKSRGGFDPAGLIPFVMLIFGGCIFYFSFKIECRRSLDFVTQLLDATTVD